MVYGCGVLGFKYDISLFKDKSKKIYLNFYYKIKKIKGYYIIMILKKKKIL